MDECHLLHLSDLHIEGGQGRSTKKLAERIGLELKRKEQRVDVVVFTGDIFHKSSLLKKNKNFNCEKNKRIKEAKIFFEVLMNYINKIKGNKIKKEDFLFVAGNHDIIREKNMIWRLYDDFLDEFYGNTKHRKYKHMVLKKYDDKKILLIGFDSNTERIEPYGKIKFEGHIEQEQLTYVENYLNKHNGFLGYKKIVFFHHPCGFFEESMGNSADGIINNAYEVSKKFTQWDIKMVLHGHKHWSRQSIYRPICGQKIYIFGADSIGINDKQKQQYSGNIIEFYDDNLEYKRLISENKSYFEIKSYDLQDDYKEGLLNTLMENFDGNSHSDDFNCVLEMINKLYLSYEQLNLLQYNTCNLQILKKSIEYKLKCAPLDLWEKMEGNEYEIMKSILDGFAIREELKEEIQNDDIKKYHFSFAILASFFVDLYNEIQNIKYVNVERELYDNVNSCYYIYFKSKNFNKVSEHRVDEDLKKIMERYQWRLYNIQEYLFHIKIRIKNIFLELLDDEKQYCNFGAAVPQLMQLLSGFNIYNNENVFARELIQNAIDAISFRERQDKERKFKQQIYIKMGSDKQYGKFFQIRDYGIGMKEETIIRYFAVLGKSYYKEYKDYDKEIIKYNSISNFGIGFLSVLKLFKKIEIKTKHFKEMKYYKLLIEKDQSYFTICPEYESDFDIGTEVSCYFMYCKKNQNDVFESIVEYIKRIMLDIKYDIIIEIKGKKTEKINARSMRSLMYKNVIFIPFEEDFNMVGRIQNYEEILSRKYVNQYRHGIMIRPVLYEYENNDIDLLSGGIFLQNIQMSDIIGKKTTGFDISNIKISMNFPPKWLEIDVSREKVKGIRDEFINEGTENLKYSICEGIQEQLSECIKDNSDVPLAYVQDVLTFMKAISDNEINQKKKNKLFLDILFNNDLITFSINIEKVDLLCECLFEIRYFYDDDKLNNIYRSLVDLFHNNLSLDETALMLDMLKSKKYLKKCRNILSEFGLELEHIDDKYLPLVLAAFVSENVSTDIDDTDNKIRKFVWDVILKNCTIQNLGKRLFAVYYNNQEQNRIVMDCDALQERVNRVAGLYNAPLNVNKYEFIWEYIICVAYKKAYCYNKDYDKLIYINDIRNNVQNTYENLKDQTKCLYVKAINSRIDIFSIAACYMGALLIICKDIAELQENENSTEKYQWILNVGLDLVYMWKLSEYIGRDTAKFKQLKNNNGMKFPNEKKYDRYIKLLIAQERKRDKFEVLYFAELLQWVDDYNESIISAKTHKG